MTSVVDAAPTCCLENWTTSNGGSSNERVSFEGIPPRGAAFRARFRNSRLAACNTLAIRRSSLSC